MKDRSDDPLRHERTHAHTTELHLAPHWTFDSWYRHSRVNRFDIIISFCKNTHTDTHSFKWHLLAINFRYEWFCIVNYWSLDSFSYNNITLPKNNEIAGFFFASHFPPDRSRPNHHRQCSAEIVGYWSSSRSLRYAATASQSLPIAWRWGLFRTRATSHVCVHWLYSITG